MSVLPQVLAGNKTGDTSTIKVSFTSELFPLWKVPPPIIRFGIDEGKQRQDEKQGQNFVCFPKQTIKLKPLEN